MPLLVAGRLVQGLGGGALTVALYVLVARIYPALLHPKIFAAFSAAWVIPSLVGPFAAGIVAQVFSWHWVFLGVVGLVIPALVMIAPVLRGLPADKGAQQPPTPWALDRLAWATLAALAVLGLNLSREVRLPGLTAAPALLAVAAVVIALVAVRPLVPRGTLAARRGLPSVILLRGLASAAFFGAEVYLPYLLIEQYDFSPTFAGLTLTGGALAWAGASAVQGRLGARLPHRRAVRIGSLMVLGAVVLALATTALHWPAAVAIAGWIFAGGGMGLLYPRLSVMTLALSAKENEGFNSSAMSISDSLGGALALATTGIVFAAFTTTTESFAGVFALAAVVAAAAVGVAPRVTSRVRGAGWPGPPRPRWWPARRQGQ
jgi:MFS family permease